ncbi:MAG: histidine phosphatase family protein [Chromatiales bacterium]|jgi:probable phosphoglycerate mutase|nr:histidine phosphatase family protein [Chromatiales bacterium]MDX9766303.1 histidine phosphatase family protein [Ectothiorhodospiraceae bacterium]
MNRPCNLIDLLRHGEPVGGRRYRGSGVDDPLSETGWSQMWRAVGDRPPFERIVSSPMRRSRDFAEGLAERLGLPLAIEPRFREIAMGAWEGLTPEEVQRRDPEGHARYYADPEGGRPAGGESLASLLERVGAGFEDVLAQGGGHLLIVSHAGVMRAILGHVLKAQANAWFQARVDYAGLTRLRIGRAGPKLEYHNRERLPESEQTPVRT